MMKSILYFIVLGFICQQQLQAQATFSDLENDKILYPSPTASGLGKYGEYPVSLYNGLVSIGQDVVTVKSGRLYLKVSLSYHSAGNKPSDIPGWVGLGFSLNAGGVITRIVRDLPDDFTGGFYTDNALVKDSWNNNLNQFYDGYKNGTLDGRSDIYQFNFCGKMGEFVFDWDRNIHFKQQVPFDIQVIYGPPGGIAGFKVTTDDGTEYTFDQVERSNYNFMAFEHPASSWYLTKISNLSGDCILLKYTQPLSKFRYKEYHTRREVTGTISYPGFELVTGPSISWNSSSDEVIYLDEIDFNNGKLIFGKSTRKDPYYIPPEITSSTAEEQKLETITLKDKSDNVIKLWKFEYFENNYERLKLKNLIVQASDQSDVQKYSFSYNNQKLPLPIPGPISQNPYISNNVDYWGYFNGATNGENRIPKMYIAEFNQFVGSANRTISANYAKAEILEKITYPTGGYTSFNFESNDYSAQGPSFAAAQNPLSESSTPPDNYELNYYRDDGGYDADPATVSFTLTEPTHVHLSYYYKADGDRHVWAPLGPVREVDYQLAAGPHSFKGLFQTDELQLEANADIIEVHCFATVYKIGPLVPIDAKLGPGLRIKSISTNDGIITRTRTFEYKLGDPESSDISSGYLSVFPAFYVPLQAVDLILQGFLVTSEPVNDIGEGPPVGYSRVIENFEDGSYIEHFFNTYEDYPDELRTFINGTADSKLAHMSSMDFRRGQEINTRYFNSDGILVKNINNEYLVLSESMNDVSSLDFKSFVQAVPSVGVEGSFFNFPWTSQYFIHSCFFYNSSTTETIYDVNGLNPVSTTVNRYYDNVKHLQPTRVITSGSDGSTITTITSYPDDFAPGIAFIDYMRGNNLISFPIEQVVYRQKDGISKIISGNIVTYKSTGAGLADNLFKLEIDGPLLLSNFKFSNRLLGVLPPFSSPTQFLSDIHYKPLLTYNKYDSKGNPLETISRSGIKTAYLWGYNKQFPVAKVIGADYATAIGKINNPLVLDEPTNDGALRSELNNLRTINGAFATTFTFAPLTGITSQSDPSGKITYYDYDLFSRLMLVRDQDNNIITKYCYNYAGQPERCSIYASAGIDGNYYSQNCLSGQDPVAYHIAVPQGMFMSYVDQQTADQLAQQYAQKQANQFGTCKILNVSIYGENNHGVNIDVMFHNISSGQNYYFTVYPHDGGSLGDVPPGNYDITLTPNTSGGWYSYSVGCGFWSDGPGELTFYDINISNSCNSIYID